MVGGCHGDRNNDHAWLIGLQISALMVFSTTFDITLTAAMKSQTLLKGVFLLGA